MKATNEEAFENLIKKYRSIAIDDLLVRSLSEITGFGTMDTCSLCVATKKTCRDCVYGVFNIGDSLVSCCKYENAATYDKLNDAGSDNELLIAIKNRADHMEKVLEAYRKQI